MTQRVALPRVAALVPLAAALASLAVAAALGGGALAMLPDGARVALAFTVLVLVPGAGWARAIGAPGVGAAGLAAGWTLGYGVAWMGAGVLLTRALGLPFTVLASAGAPWAVLPWLLALRLAPRERVQPATLSRLAWAAIALAALFAFLHVSAVGTPVSFHTDSPDHIGTIRRMLASGDAFPEDAFFRDAGPAGADPRKGLWHPIVALVCALSHVDPFPAWRLLAALLAPLFVWNAAAFAYRLGGGFAAAVAAWALPLTYGGGLGAHYLSEAVFATKLADQLGLAVAAALLADLAEPRARSRLAVAGLLLGAVFAHVFAAIQFALVAGAFGLGLLLRERAFAPAFRRVLLTALTAGGLALPYLLWRASQAYAPVNPIHTETQGMLELMPGVRVVSFGALWDWLGPPWLLFPLSLVAWVRRARADAVLMLLTSTLVVGTLMFVPPVVHVLEPRLGYLLMRLPWLLPASAAVAFAAVWLRDTLAAQRPLAAAGGALVLAAALWGPLGDAALAWSHPAHVRTSEDVSSVLRWSDMLAWMDRELPAGTVVMSDPATAYSVPMLTRHWVTLLSDQHSSPNDPHALERILDARDALDPFAPYARTAEAVKRWGATVIVLNGRIEPGPGLDYWSAGPEWYAAARARLDRAPGAFEKLAERDTFTVYRVHPEVLDTLSGGGAPRPFVHDMPASASEHVLGAGLPALAGFTLAPLRAAPGDTLRGVVEWRAQAPLAAGIYRVSVRFDRPLPAGTPAAPRAVSKPWRKLLERLHHQRYRFRADHLPVSGAFGVDRWPAQALIRDAFELVVPGDVAPGTYTVRVTMVRQAHYPNLRLRDLLDDDDLLAGVAVGTLEVHAGGAR